jgi:hypothetical protein
MQEENVRKTLSQKAGFDRLESKIRKIRGDE